MYDRFQSEPFIKIHLIFTFHQHDLHNYFPSRTTHPSSVGGERKRAKMNGRDNSGMQSHARNRALPSPFPWYVRLVTESFRETTEGRGNLARLCSHNRTRITARDGGGMGEKNSRSIIHTRDGRCWFSFDLCCATPLGRPCQSMRACAALPDGRRGSGEGSSRKTAVQYICRE